MGNRRMFSREVVETDAFLDLSKDARLLYFELGLNGDDDGFVSNPKFVMRMCGCSQKDCEALVAAGFLIPFESGVVAIRHWFIHNTIQNDRKHDTLRKAEMAKLVLLTDNTYCLKEDASKLDTNCIRIDSGSETEVNSNQSNPSQEKKRKGKGNQPLQTADDDDASDFSSELTEAWSDAGWIPLETLGKTAKRQLVKLIDDHGLPDVLEVISNAAESGSEVKAPISYLKKALASAGSEYDDDDDEFNI